MGTRGGGRASNMGKLVSRPGTCSAWRCGGHAGRRAVGKVQGGRDWSFLGASRGNQIQVAKGVGTW